MSCKFCGGEGNACQACIDGIVARMQAGQSTASIAASMSTDDLYVTRNMVIGIWTRNKPKDVFHPGACRKSRETRAKNKALGITAVVHAVLTKKPTDLGPHDPVGCRWIDGDPREDWEFCQRRKRRGSYCEYHHRKAHKTPDQAKRDKEKWLAEQMPNGSRFKPMMAHQ